VIPKLFHKIALGSEHTLILASKADDSLGDRHC
jgi:hypothetical protein